MLACVFSSQPLDFIPHSLLSPSLQPTPSLPLFPPLSLPPHLRAATSPAATAPAASPSTERSSPTRTSRSSTRGRASSRWPTRAPEPTARRYGAFSVVFLTFFPPLFSLFLSLTRARPSPPFPLTAFVTENTRKNPGKPKKLIQKNTVLPLHRQDRVARRQARRLRQRHQRHGRRQEGRVVRQRVGRDVEEDRDRRLRAALLDFERGVGVE